MSDARALNDAELARAAGACFALEYRPRWLVARFFEPQLMLSWAIVGGGFTRRDTVVFHEVTDGELRPPVDPERLYLERLAARGLSDAVGLLTSRRLESYEDVTVTGKDVTARSVATVGLGNALRAGDPPGPSARIGTINVLCALNTAVSEAALVEALALCAEARALAVREADIESRMSGSPASGTGTDCIVVAAPSSGPKQRYAGKHTELGWVIGEAVISAVRAGAEQWKAERRQAQAR